MTKKIVLIGAGNTATVLGRKMMRHGHRILQICGRNENAARELAMEFECGYITRFESIDRNADLVVLAVSDNAVENVAASLDAGGSMVVHTAGSVSINVLKPAGRQYGVLYPVQSLRKSIAAIPQIPFAIDGADSHCLELIREFAASLSDDIIQATDEQRLKLHLAAVVCNNFVNHLHDLAEQFCHSSGIDFNILLPLIRETAERTGTMPARALQTGPAIRNDDLTISRHIDLLWDHPQLEQVYRLLTESIRNGNDNGSD